MTLNLLPTLLLSLKIASVATLLILGPATLIGYILARYDFVGKNVVSAIVGLPLVLPPTAIGFLLLRLLAHDGILGRETLGFDLDLLLNWKAAVLATAIMSAPLVTRTARVTFEGIDPRLEAMARTLGHGRLSTWFRFTLPLARRGLTAGVILGFTRALGEFGATVTVAGNIRGKTQTLASAIFESQQIGDQDRAGILMVVSVLLGFAAIVSSEMLSRHPISQGGRR